MFLAGGDTYKEYSGAEKKSRKYLITTEFAAHITWHFLCDYDGIAKRRVEAGRGRRRSAPGDEL